MSDLFMIMKVSQLAERMNITDIQVYVLSAHDLIGLDKLHLQGLDSLYSFHWHGLFFLLSLVWL